MSTTRTGGRRFAAAIAIAAGLALALTGCGETPGTAQPVGPGAPAPSVTPTTAAPSPTPEPNLSEDLLLTDDNFNAIGEGWETVSTGSDDDGDFLLCQPAMLASLGATEVLVRTFERPGAEISPDGVTAPNTVGGHLIAYFGDDADMSEVNQAVNTWLRTCADHPITDGGDVLHFVKGALAVDTVHPRGPERPGSGEVWGFTFDDENTDDYYGWFPSVGYGIVGPYLTIVNYTDWGQDANYDTDKLPGVVLLQDAFDKLPS
ncbi:MAG: hypothetical protein L0Y54_11960 [Sporichthyaceae bacterium]|nr:hypothetical protein [Sporichthyaceae bacterium]